MIEAKDLRIGNKFAFGKNRLEETVFQITFDRRENHLINGQIPEEHCFGIELSEEWLIKDFTNKGEESVNEYEKNLSVWQYNKDDKIKIKHVHAWYGGENHIYYQFYYDDNSLKTVEHIHEIQNLIHCLTGTELEIK